MGFNSIDITNFRGIEQLRIENLSSINIFTGRNNVGKSSCLEAIALVASGHDGFKDLFGDDLLEFIVLRRSDDTTVWDYLIRNDASSAMIIANKSITSKNKNDDENIIEGILIGEDFDKMQTEPSVQLVTSLKKKEEEFYEQRRSPSLVNKRRKSESEIKRQMYFYYKNDTETLAKIFEYGYSNVGVIESRTTKLEKNNGVIFIKGFENEEILHDMTAIRGNLHKTIRRLSEKIPDFEDLRKIGDTLFVFFKNKPQMPLSMMGDGFKAGILTTLYAQSLSNGILILEEPENYLHPGLMMHLVDELILACDEQKIQIFISTHSDELIKFCLERSKNVGVSVIRMSNLEGHITAEVLPKKVALKQINELGLDLRGI